ncbi:cation efflux family-domain-containing protein [Mycotypha africana]|uniref:cation efflux family-domain-containing protein n=1 Tax=Mycotypha africana TaxID=64632 RepID=UPI002300EB65|nr:cation efflux family-domain-containing protein [Mycotypha africana]KAI8979632.1 cation efflux family-domain-containing protein [Mycotypha africana]
MTIIPESQTKGGVTIQSSAPLYSHRTHDKDKIPHLHQSSPQVKLNLNADYLLAQQQPTAYGHVDNKENINYSNHLHHDETYAHDDHHEHHDHHGHRGHHDHANHYDHLGHEHNHNHQKHSHDHHEHKHAHPMHDHKHTYTPVFTKPLPSWSTIFSNLIPVQKTIFTWFLIHFSIGAWLYCLGMSRESLSLIGFGYLMFFDALGVLNCFVSSILRTNSNFGISNTKRPYGAHRYEIVFALGTTIYLLFATMHNTKESLEHFLLQDHHAGEAHEGEQHHSSSGLTPQMFFAMGAGIAATCLSSIALKNHENFVRYLRRRPMTVHGFAYNVINRARGNPIHVLLSNTYSFSIASCGATILIMYLFGFATPLMDKSVALMESVVMFYLGYPTAKALAKVLLQTAPGSVQSGVDNRLRELSQEPNIIQANRVHFWQTTYGKCVGTVEVHVKPEADEQSILQVVYQKLEGLTTSEEGQNELTVSIVKQ